jgi:hypothetical protein
MSLGMGKLGSNQISKTIRLSNTDGTDAWTILDGDGVPIHKFCSDGTIKTKAPRIQRL